ncbi:MAG: hypothetical protein R2854_05840 [Caldilineaceae bacterium]
MNPPPTEHVDAAATPTPTPVAEALDARGIALATLLVMVFFVLSRVTGLAREIVIGAQFGTSAQLDAYLARSACPTSSFNWWRGCAAAAFIPTFAGYWVKDDRAAVAALLTCSIW